MLISQASRDLRDAIDERWKVLIAWLDNPANVAAMSKVRASIDPLSLHWKAVDRGLLSDTDEVQSACHDIGMAEKYAAEQGYVPPPSRGCPTSEQLVPAPIAQAGHAVEDYCKEHADSVFCAATSPKPLTGPGAPSWCQRLALPAAICTDRGLEDWFVWVLAGGAVLVAGGVAAVALAPYAAAARGAGIMAHRSVPPHVLRALEEEQRRKV